MKTLYLVRHAKSSWKDSSLPDEQRPLNKRGKRNAPAMGEYLAGRCARVERLVASPARRALMTARFSAAALDYDLDAIVQQPQLYFSGISGMLDVVHATNDEVRSLMLVGHNPDMTSFVNNLCGYQTDNMPTCAVATIEFDGEWSDVLPGRGRLVDYKIPREL